MKKILIIEDDQTVRENLNDILTSEYYEVITANNGKSGLQLAFDNIPDLILCDLLMPEMNGYEVIHYVKQNPATRDIPFIFLTAKVDLTDIRKGMETGADDYITKPFSVKDLVTAVKIRLERSENAKKKFKDLTLSLEMSLPHELRTPLFGILGFSKLLADNADTYSKEEIKDFAENIYMSGKRLHHLIENFLYLAKIELMVRNNSIKDELTLEQISQPSGIINQSAIEIAKAAERVDDLKVNVEDFIVRINLEGFIKIFDELIDNAFKFSNKGDKVEISSRTEGEYNVISIMNSGKSMTGEQIAAIMPHMQFERKIYEQQGAGLGLSIAMKIIELHKGNLKIHSENNSITFEVYLLKP